MKKILKALFTALILLLFLPAVSCGGEKQNENSLDINKNDPKPEENGAGEEKSGPKSPVPDDLKFTGETVRFFNYYFEVDTNGTVDPAMATLTNAETASGDVVYEAVYKRNMEVQDKFGVTFKFTHCPSDADPDKYQNSFIAKIVNSGSDEFDIVIGKQFQCVRLASENMFRNIKDLPYLDITNPWWAEGYINELTVGKNTLMYITGDISAAWLNRLGTIYFNREVYKNYIGENPDDLYKMVLDGKWTMDALYNIVKNMYADLDGDGVQSDGDMYGLITHTISATDYFTYGSGIHVTSHDENGFPYFVINNEKTVEFVDKLYDLYYNNQATRLIPQSQSNFNDIFNDKFAANESLFRDANLGVSSQLRSMQADFGMIPFPKLDETIPSYSSLVHDTAPLICVPETCSKDDEFIGAVIEEMAFKGYTLMTPAYFDVALKNKYMRDSDDMAMRCLDIIRENAVTDFAYVYNYALKPNPDSWDTHVGLIMRDLMGKKSNNFASFWEKVEKPAADNLQKIIDAYINK